MTIPDDLIEQVREAADLVAIIGEHVELKRQGSDFRGPCPFHGGTHRNFAVIPKKGCSTALSATRRETSSPSI